MQLDTSQILAGYNLAPDVICLENGTQLSQLGVVRHVPNKRIVCQANWQNIRVYAKLFVGKNVEKYAARDAAGVAQLRAANVLTPSLLYQGATNKTSDKSAQVLLFEEIQAAKNAEDVYQTLLQNHQYQARLDLMLQLTATLARHHNAGLLQADMYFKNFLVENDKIYTLDGDGIRKYTRLSKSQLQRNLATLFSKMDVLEDKWIPKLYEAYCQQTGVTYAVFDEAKIWAQTQKIRRQTASHYADQKVFRQCTDVKKYTLGCLWILVCREYENINFAGNLDTLFTEQNLLKNGNTCTVALSEMGGKKIVIKRYNIKSFWHGFSRAFRQTRAAASWANAHRLKLLGVATAEPIALIEQRNFCLFKSRAYFLAEYVEALDAAQFFAKTRDKTQRAQVIKNIVTLFYKLYLLQISHGDMKASNLKISGLQPVLIDLDSMRQHQSAFFFERAHVRDLCRFMQNWQDDNALYNAFVKTFRVIYEDLEPLEKAGIFNNKELTE